MKALIAKSIDGALVALPELAELDEPAHPHAQDRIHHGAYSWYG